MVETHRVSSIPIIGMVRMDKLARHVCKQCARLLVKHWNISSLEHVVVCSHHGPNIWMHVVVVPWLRQRVVSLAIQFAPIRDLRAHTTVTSSH